MGRHRRVGRPRIHRKNYYIPVKKRANYKSTCRYCVLRKMLDSFTGKYIRCEERSGVRNQGCVDFVGPNRWVSQNDIAEEEEKS